jgi:CrcB protein
VSPWGWVGFVVAGAVGAPLRYLVDGAIADRVEGRFPWGTFVVNVTGSLLLGFLAGLSLYHAFPATPKVVLGTGFCGAYTTFSTFSFETIRLLEEGAVATALRYVAGTAVVCATAAGAGLSLATL